MDGERHPAPSHRLSSLATKFRDKQYRDGYVASHTRRLLAEQMRNFRGELSQADYAEKIGKQKTVIARLENPAYGGWSLRTMLDIARRQNVAVIARFVDFPTFLGFTDDMSDEAFRPHAYDQSEIDWFSAYQSGQIGYYDLGPSISLYGGLAMQPSAYGDISPRLSPLNNITIGGTVTAVGTLVNYGAASGGSGIALIGQLGQPLSWSGAPIFATASFTTPATPGALARAHAEIRRLQNLVTTQSSIMTRQERQIAELEAQSSQAGPIRAITRPQSQVIPLKVAA